MYSQFMMHGQKNIKLSSTFAGKVAHAHTVKKLDPSAQFYAM